MSKANFVPIVKRAKRLFQSLNLAFTHEGTEKVAKNYRALNILFCGLDSNEFNNGSACDTTEEVSDTLETTYEGNNQV